MKRAAGFTLIELVVVIIILGILAVTAAPKFINLQSDARVSTLEGLEGAFKGANALVFSKAAIAGKEQDSDTTLDIGGATDPKIRFGYLQGDEASIKEALQIELATSGGATLADWYFVADSPSAGIVTIYQSGSPYSATDDCHIEYTPAASAGALPTYNVESDDC
ncbi:type II secretion system protein [Paraferrimonas haliotis]|uniref:PilD processed protein n=1 Tax=Paraferrimonas haliotis TaxID=2013866 RepID=A0AA37TT40_9GAMM|nr:prepilin-type N-terminal cleavage/methylation domain-containing protein [Paraferrimonas haliotis]GLS82345.1 PilD processed protein [Paraferrimonas haliotis]